MSGKVTHGADVEELDDIAVALRRQVARICDVGGRGAAQLERLRALWDGPDFEKFAKEWHAAHRSIDEAESALRTYSRTLAAESEQQRQSSHLGSVPPVASAAPTAHAAVAAPGEDAQQEAWGRVEQLRHGVTGLTVDSSQGPVLLASPHGMLITDRLMPTLPDLPGLEVIGADEPGQGPTAFERLGAADAATSTPAESARSGAPAQIPTGDGSHVTTAADSAGQRSVAFDPRGLAARTDWADSSSVGGWLGLDGPGPRPWTRG
ncbi:WXG100 family type VII secretion target [Janibacter sp. GS2]|uniref:WXG100 family type VII secretion target n=1 Tax=Janibacter sp. GS2 TaxID=3442646 RepID=UPI003EB75406